MPELAAYHPGDRVYGRVVFTRSAYETDSIAATTATVTLTDPTGADVSVTPVLTNADATAQVDWEYTLPSNALTGTWRAIVQTATALIATDVSDFRVMRLPD